jgi:septal ring factor EnvC (AmiA/AmiB activator)
MTSWPRIPRVLPLLLVAAVPLLAQAQEEAAEDPRARLEELQRAIEAGQAEESAAQARFRALQTEVARLRQESIEAAARAQALERQLSTAELAVAFRRASEMRQRARLAERNAQLGVTLGALQRIALQPPESLLSSPGNALETARSALLLSTTVPELERRAEVVRAEVRQLAALTEATAAERDALAGTRADLEEQQARLEELAEQKISLQQQALADSAEAAARVQALADQAEDVQGLLRDLAAEAEARRKREAGAALSALRRTEEARQAGRAAIEEQRAEPAADVARAVEAPASSQATSPAQVASVPATALERPGSVRPFPTRRDSLRLPVTGSLAVGFGEPQADGIDARSRGIYMETRPGAQVVAPYDGQVVFAGRFRRYGLLLIIEHDGRYHSLLSGLERIDAVVGQWVLAGEPVGVMAGRTASGPRLYYELRRDSQPIDPLPWLAMDEERARG